jgi:hypothetical protein
VRYIGLVFAGVRVRRGLLWVGAEPGRVYQSSPAGSTVADLRPPAARVAALAVPLARAEGDRVEESGEARCLLRVNRPLHLAVATVANSQLCKPGE